MTDEELLKSIRTIFSEEIKEQTDHLIDQMEVFEAKQMYFEQMFRSIIQEQRVTKETLGAIQKELKSFQKEQQVTKETLEAIQKEQQTTKETLGAIQQQLKFLQVEVIGVKKIQKRQGVKINSIHKTVDIIVRTYDERIVANWREIEKIKKRLEL